MKNVKLIAFVGMAAVLASACAHAAPTTNNMCPAGTKTAVLMQQSALADGFPIEQPPETGAMENTIQTWDISGGGNGQPFFWECAGTEKPVEIPTGRNSCSFDPATGVANCI